MRQIYQRIFSVLICIAWANFVLAETTLHVVVCADSNDERLKFGLNTNISNLQGLFKQNVPKSQLDFHEISGDATNINFILRKIRSISVDSDDALIFFFTGHGAFEVNRQEHLITLNNNEILKRSVLLAELKAKNPQLTVLITDTCSNLVDIWGNSPESNSPARISPLFHSLFVQTRGVVDISGTKPGEIARLCNYGSAFVLGFSEVLGNSQRTISWASVISELNAVVMNDINRRIFNMKLNQTAYAVQPLPGTGATVPSRQKYWLGAYAQAYSGGGVEITKVVANSPASKIADSNGNSMRLVPFRDIVTHVNGTAVSSNDEFIAAIRRSGKVARLQVYDRQTQSSGIYRAFLVPID